MCMNKTDVNKRLGAYLHWPLYLSLILLVANGIIYCVDRRAGVVMTIMVILYIAIALGLFFSRKSSIMTDLIHYASNYSQVQRSLIQELMLPYAILDTQGCLVWGNDAFLELVGDVRMGSKNISDIISDITEEVIPDDMLDRELHIHWNERDYQVVLRRIDVDSFDESGKRIQEEEAMENDNVLITMYLRDETKIREYMQEIDDRRLVVGLLYIDNYDEVLSDRDDMRASMLTALIDRRINKYMQSVDAIVKKLEKDKYVFMFKNRYLPQLEKNKFSLLEEVRSINVGGDMSATISIGLGINDESYLKSYEFARIAMDLALGRGGDQAVIKNGDKISYYGGKSVQIEKKTRVKARVKAHALRELMETRERVLIMGHSIGDVDSFGSAIGIYRIAKTLGKKAHIVINEITTSVRPVINRFLTNGDYEEDMFLNSQQALEIEDSNMLLVVVDVNRANYTECPQLLEQIKTIVVLDHHRQVGDGIENAVLSYIEPYASSACEMVTEILQYVDDNLKLRQVEADAMYSGIVIDSNNFLTKTGVRTFEAAAFLRRCGADITRVRKIFRISRLEYQLRAEAVRGMEIYMDHYAITECKAEGVDSPTILGAQVANELLNISDVKASFVLTEYNHKIYISARSIDELNVQLVMEQLGGGGHLSVAGAQLTNVDMEQGKQMIRDVLKQMVEDE